MVHKKHKQTIHELKERIKHARQAKQKIVEHAELLRFEYENHQLTKKKYLELCKKRIHGKSIEEWITYYDKYIAHCQTKIRHKEIDIGRRTLAFVGIGLLAISIVALLFFQNDVFFAGFSVSDAGSSSSGDSGSSSSSGDSGSGDSGGGSSSSSSSEGSDSGGSSSDSGSSSSSGDSESESSTSDSSEGGDSEDGGSPSESESSSSDSIDSETESESSQNSESSDDSEETESESSESPSETESSENPSSETENENSGEEENNEGEETEEESEEKETETEEEAEETESSGTGGSSSEDNNKTETTQTEENKTETTTNITNETVIEQSNETNITNLPEGTGEETTVNITNETVVNETKQTEENETIEGGNITTVQYKAVLGKPVRWKKRIDLEKPGSTKVQIPKEALNISVKKVTNKEDSNKEKQGTEENPGSEENEESLEDEDEPDDNAPRGSIGGFGIAADPLLELEETNTEQTGQEDQKDQETVSREDGEVKEDAEFSITGKVIDTKGAANTAEQSKITQWLRTFFERLFSTFTGRAIQDLENNTTEIQEIEITDDAGIYEVEYETPAPYAIETDTRKGKTIEIIGPEGIHYEQVLSFTEFSDDFNIKDSNRIKLRWIENNTYLKPTLVDDLNNDGNLDYVEWITPHLSNQTIEIILITKAEHLDENKSFIADIYNETSELDDVWVSINDSQWVRVTFEQNLTNEKDITLFARSNHSNATVEVYHFNTSSGILATFNTINTEGYYKIFLTNMTGSHDTFDLKILGGIDIDLIIDPTNITEITYHGWPQNFTSARSETDHAEDTVIDSNDHIYHVGWGYNLTATDNGWSIDTEDDWWIKKFFLNGTEITDGWNKKINNVLYNDSDRALGVAVDSKDNVYVVGYTNNTTIITGGGYGGYDWWIKQFNSSGDENTTWAMQLDGAVTGTRMNTWDDIAWSVTVDINDSVYIVGSASEVAGPGSSGVDAAIRKYWANSTQALNNWNNVGVARGGLFFDGGFQGDDSFMDADTDFSGNVTIVGYAFDGASPGGGNGDDWWIHIYDEPGTFIGTGGTPCGGATGFCYNFATLDDRLHAVKETSSGAFHVTGFHDTNAGNGKDTIIYTYDNNGTQNATSGTWTSQWAEDDEGNELVTDEIYAAQGGDRVIWVGYHTFNGAQRWTTGAVEADNKSLINYLNNSDYENAEGEGIWNASTREFYTAGWGTNITNTSLSGSEEDWWLRHYEAIKDYTPATIRFVDPTPADTETINYTDIEVNVSIDERDLASITYEWNGKNYTFYNESLRIMFNFDNRTDIFDNYTQGNEVYDSSGGGNNGTFDTPNVYQYNQTGKYGKSKIFNSTSTQLNLSNSTNINNLQNFTISFWYNLQDHSNQSKLNGFLHKYNGSGYALQGNASGGEIIFSDTCGLIKETEKGILQTEGWHQLTVTIGKGCKSDDVHIYHDGTEPSYDTNTGGGQLQPNGWSKLILGTGIAEADPSMNGSMDDFYLWNRTFTADEVDQFYMTRITQLTRTTWNFYVLQQENATDVNLENGDYTIQTWAKDEIENLAGTEKRTITISVDSEPPFLKFVNPTQPNGSKIAQNYYYINISLNETPENFTIQMGEVENLTLWSNSTTLAAFDFNNLSALGENLTEIYDVTSLGNNATCVTIGTCPTVETGNDDNWTLGGSRNFDGGTYLQIKDNSPQLHELDINTSLIMTAWVKMNDSAAPPMPIISFQNAKGVGASMVMESSNEVAVRFNTTNNSILCQATHSSAAPEGLFSDNNWHHIVYEWNAYGGQLFLWIDGEEQGSAGVTCNSGNLSLPAEEWYIGYENDTGNYFNGSIAQVRIIQGNRSAGNGFGGLYTNGGTLHRENETKWIYRTNISRGKGTYNYSGWMQDTAGNWNTTGIRFVELGADLLKPDVNFSSPTPANGTTTDYNWTEINTTLVDREENLAGIIFTWNGSNYTLLSKGTMAYYNFNNQTELDENGSRIADIDNNTDDTTGTQNITNISSGAWITPTGGKYGGAAHFDGTADGYLSTEPHKFENFTNGSFTISAWYHQNTQADIVPNGIITQKDSFGLLIDESTLCPAFYHKNSTGAGSFINDTQICTGDAGWQHITVSSNGTWIRMAKNGTIVNDSQSGAYYNINNSLAAVIMGRDSYLDFQDSNRNFNGSIDDVMIHDGLLAWTATEMQIHYETSIQRRNSTTWHTFVNKTNITTNGLEDSPYTYHMWTYDENDNYNTTGERTTTIKTINSPPEIFYVEPVTGAIPLEGTNNSLLVTFNVSDLDGVVDLNLNTVTANFSNLGEGHRYNNSCIWTTNFTAQNTAQFTCHINMTYFDKSGAWNINVSIADVEGAYAENTTETFTYQQLHAMQVPETNISFPIIYPDNTDIESADNPVIVLNTGNADILSINITGFNLRGWNVDTHIIYAENFTVGPTSGCEQTALENATETIIGGAAVGRGEGASGELHFCLEEVPPTVTAQAYNTSYFGSWDIGTRI